MYIYIYRVILGKYIHYCLLNHFFLHFSLEHETNIQLLWQFHQKWSGKTWSSAVVRLSKVRTESSRRLQRTATSFHQVFDSLQNGTSISLPPKNQHPFEPILLLNEPNIPIISSYHLLLSTLQPCSNGPFFSVAASIGSIGRSFGSRESLEESVSQNDVAF